MTESFDSHAVNFSDLPADGLLFECFVQELLQELGFSAERTGEGPDLGVDIVAETTVFDEIGGSRRKRYIIECKHYAHSNRSIGLADLQGLSIVDRIILNGADGFLLVCSTTISSSLREAFRRLEDSHKDLHFSYWDKVAISRKLAECPVVTAKYFPGLVRRPVLLVRPQAPPKRGCYDQIIEHQREFVGIKFIPKLYVPRAVEGEILLAVGAQTQRLRDAEAVIRSVCANHIEKFTTSPLLPEGIKDLPFTKNWLCWTIAPRELGRMQASILTRLSHLNVDLLYAYEKGGIAGLRLSFHRISQFIASVQREMSATIDRHLEALQRLVSFQSKAQDYVHITGKKRSYYDSRLRAALRGYPLRVVAKSEVSGGAVPFDEMQEILLRMRALASIDLLGSARDLIQVTLKPLQVIVDVAGSGKTNLSCKLALQLTQNCFSVFLTGRSHLRAFSEIEDFLSERIASIFPHRAGFSLQDNCAWLHHKGLPLTLVIDGINEAQDINAVLIEFRKILTLSQRAPFRAVVTTRNEYWQFFEPIARQSDSIVERRGELSRFSEDELGVAIPAYLDHYKLRVRIEQRAWDQLRRPLILRFFCEAYGNPRRNKLRELPPIRSVQLNRLFAEYCSVKYRNIAVALRAAGERISKDDIQEILLAIADELLAHRATGLKVSYIKDVISRKYPGREAVYSALLDEDVIIDEVPDVFSMKTNERRMTFVYEAFMEFLMASVVCRDCQGRDVSLLRRIKTLFSQEESFHNIRGMSVFLLPLCWQKFHRSFKFLVKSLEDERGREVCVSALLNLSEAPWFEAVWPVLRAIAGHVPVVSLEDVEVFLCDWLDHNEGKSFLETAIEDPRSILRIGGFNAVKILKHAQCEDEGTFCAAGLQLLRHSGNEYLVESLLRNVAECNIQSYVRWEEVIEVAMPWLSDIFGRPPHQRDWAVLWVLGRLGLRYDKVSIDLGGHLGEALGKFCTAALYDCFYRGQLLGPEAVWLASFFGLDTEEIRGRVNDVLNLDGRFWLEDEELWAIRKTGSFVPRGGFSIPEDEN